MTVIVKHNKTNTITDWTQAQLDEQIALGNFPSGTTLANIVLPSDWNNDHTLTGLGTMAEQDATAVAITGGTINNTTIGATTATTGKFTSVTTPSVTATTNDLTLSAISTGNFNVNTPNGTAFKVLPVSATSSNWLQVGNPSTTVIRLGPAGTTIADFRILAPTFTSFHTGSSADGLNDGANQMRISHTASAVNFVQVTGGATNNSPVISSQGSDSNVALSITSKGTNAIRFLSNNAANLQFRIVGTNTAVNNLAVTGTIATNAPSLSSEGSDTNISMAFQPKGTGAIDLAAGSSGVNISNGGTVTAITRSGTGTGYTSKPTIAISAPTTAGGVQATATIDFMSTNATAIVSGGTGYTVGNVLTVVGGTPVVSATTMTVATVSSGVITSVTIANFGSYSTLPTNPVSVTGGTGSGATFNLTYSIGNAFTISNAGSGYIEQPTITFSGGGGSGAAAFANVGGTARVTAISSVMELATSSGVGFRVSNSGTTNVNFLGAQGNSSGGTAGLYGFGADTDVSVGMGSKAAGNVRFFTNTSVEQLRVSHTASAVNYVQVTGGAAGNPPSLQAQGSDATIAMLYVAKGGQDHRFFTNSGSAEQFRVINTAGTIANQTTATGSATGVAPIFGVRGTDTNIDLALTPKGTGLVRFGTYTAGALTATGYINIKAADGTTYKVLVST
jgi:hypothetical protein